MIHEIVKTMESLLKPVLGEHWVEIASIDCGAGGWDGTAGKSGRLSLFGRWDAMFDVPRNNSA